MDNNKSEVEEENISANVLEDGARKIVETEYGLIATKIVRVNGYDDLNFFLPPPLITNNDFHVSQLWPHGYLLKIINSRDSKNLSFFNEYINVLLHLNKENFPCPCPVPNKDGKYLGYWSDGNSKAKTELSTNSEPRKHIFMLLTFLQGEILERFKYSQQVDTSLGRLLSQLHTKLKALSQSYFVCFIDSPSPQLKDYTVQISHGALHSAPNVVESHLHVITDEEKLSLFSNVIDEFKTVVIPNLHSIDRGVIHGDLNLGNVLVQRKTSDSEHFDIAAIIDFTDMHNSYFIFDLALTACYIGLHDVDHCEDRIASLLSGYEKELSDLELELLKICICTRLCQSITIAMHTLSIDPNNEYVKNNEPMLYGWQFLKKLSEISHTEFKNLMRSKIQLHKNEKNS